MKRSLALVTLIGAALATPAHATLLLYDGFEYTAGELLAPSNDTTASPNPGQYNGAFDVNWRYAGSGAANTNAPGVASGTLSYSGLLPSAGNSVALNATQLGSARIGFANQTISTSATVYWSALVNVIDVNTLTGANGILVGGFNNSNTPGTLPGVYGTVLRIRNDPDDSNRYFVGTGLSSGTATGGSGPTAVFGSASYAEGDTVLVVGSYTFVAGANNDIAQMWINPDPSTFGALAAPAATITSAPGTGVNDPVTNVSSFNLRNVNTVGLPDIRFDELRVGTAWADVTPAAIPETKAWILVFAACGLAAGGKAALAPLRRRMNLNPTPP